MLCYVWLFIFIWFDTGEQMTYADILTAHLITWICEEAGAELLNTMPKLVDLQLNVIEIPSISKFIKSKNKE